MFLRRSPNFSVSVAHDNLRWVESFFQDFTFLTETNQCPTSPETCSAIMLYRAETSGLFPLKKGEGRGAGGMYFACLPFKDFIYNNIYCKQHPTWCLHCPHTKGLIFVDVLVAVFLKHGF